VAEQTIRDYVFSLSDEDFEELLSQARNRLARRELGAETMEELALLMGRKPFCPACGASDAVRDGKARNGSQRYRCPHCGRRFGLLSTSVLSSAKASLWQWAKMCGIMAYNVPLDAVACVIGVSHNTALLMRRKLLETAGDYQKGVTLSGKIYIDEVYEPDSARPKDHFGPNVRGLSKDKVCVFVAIDESKRVVAFQIGHGAPTSSEVREALLPHLGEGAELIVHDGLLAHREAIRRSGLPDEVHLSKPRTKEGLEAMLLINSCCSWLQRFISGFSGMRTEYLQDYLNWFAFSLHVKLISERGACEATIMGHVAASMATIKRRGIGEKRRKSRAAIEAKRLPGRKKSSPKGRDKESKEPKNRDGS
jgi:transposase-like protein